MVTSVIRHFFLDRYQLTTSIHIPLMTIKVALHLHSILDHSSTLWRIVLLLLQSLVTHYSLRYVLLTYCLYLLPLLVSVFVHDLKPNFLQCSWGISCWVTWTMIYCILLTHWEQRSNCRIRLLPRICMVVGRYVLRRTSPKMFVFLFVIQLC